MPESKVSTLPRWEFRSDVAHICECCDFLCQPGILVCPKCQTKLGEFSRPVRVTEAAEPVAQPIQHPTPQPQPAQAVELLARCPHCNGVLSLKISG